MIHGHLSLMINVFMKRTTLGITAFGISILSLFCLAFLAPSGSSNPALQLISPHSVTLFKIQQSFFPWVNQTENKDFQIQVCKKAIDTSIPEKELSRSSQHDIRTVPAKGRYYWLAGLLNEKKTPGERGDLSSVDLAKFLPPIPAAPVPLSPAALSFTNNQTPSFSWGSVPYANSYDFEISTDAAFSRLVNTAHVEASATKQIDFTPMEPLSPDGWYYWRVRAKILVEYLGLGVQP